MTHPFRKCEEMPTRQSLLTLCGFCQSDEILSLSFKETFTKYARYNPIISKKERLAQAASRSDTNVTLVFTAEKEVVAFGILEYPQPDERWVKVGDRIMMEVSVIEISRPWRSAGIAKPLLRLLTDHPLKEQRILYMVGYSWTWDLDSRGIPPMTYRDMMVHLFASCGFKIFQTNEPNIMLRPENLFMARIGADVPEDVQQRFKRVRFGLE